MKKVSEEDFTHGRRFRNNVTRIRNVTYEIETSFVESLFTLFDHQRNEIYKTYTSITLFCTCTRCESYYRTFDNNNRYF